jgi:hypothetical protein
VFGVDLVDLLTPRALPTQHLVQGDEGSARVNVLVESEQPAATSGVELYVSGHCARDLPDGVSCRAVGERSFGNDKLPSYEIMLEGQAYGLFVAFDDVRMLGSVGTGRVRLAATSDTPEGHYEVPLQAAFVGYAPARCSLLARLQKRCEPAQRGPRARHEDLAVSGVVVEVQHGTPGRQTTSDRQRAQAEADQLHRAEQRAAQIEQAMAEIKAVLDDTQNMLRHQRYDDARERIDKLDRLFAPLDALAVSGSEAELPPAEVTGLRARFEAQRRELNAFRDRAFDAAYAALNRPREAGEDEDAALTSAAHKLGISREFLEAIYAEHADQLEARLARKEAAKHAAEQAAADAVQRRCGTLPTTSWREVQGYLAAMSRSAQVKTRLDECFTPRLSTAHCWSVVCKFDEIAADPGRLTDTIRSHTWTFLLQKQRVVSHSERVLEDP